MKAKHQRLTLVVLAVVALIGAGLLAMLGLKDQAAYFYQPAALVKADVPPGQAIRLGDSLDHPCYDEACWTSYCGFDPSRSRWISVIFLAFSLPEHGIVLPRSVGYNVFVPWVPPDS